MAGGGSIKRKKKKKKHKGFAYDGRVGRVILELVRININATMNDECKPMGENPTLHQRKK